MGTWESLPFLHTHRFCFGLVCTRLTLVLTPGFDTCFQEIRRPFRGYLYFGFKQLGTASVSGAPASMSPGFNSFPGLPSPAFFFRLDFAANFLLGLLELPRSPWTRTSDHIILSPLGLGWRRATTVSKSCP